MFILFLLGLQAWGQKGPTVHVHQLDPYMRVERMAQPGVQVHKLTPALAPRKESLLLNPAFQKKLLTQSQLLQETDSWDTFERDVFFIRAKNLDIDRCAAKYASLPKEKILRLKKLIHEELSQNP